MRPEPRHWGHILWARMRLFVFVLGAAYLLGTLAYWAIPAQLPDGTPVQTGFVDALYMTAITATTIGFGEFPYPFTASQRLFTLVFAHVVVISWLLFAGGFIATIQSKSFRTAFGAWRFRRRVRALKEPFAWSSGTGKPACVRWII